MAAARDYKREYATFHKKKAQRVARSDRNKARRVAKKAGIKIAGKDVHHKDNNPANNKRKNLTVKSASSNRSFKRSGVKYGRRYTK